MAIHHAFSFTPVNRACGWVIAENGNPRIWWYVRLVHEQPVFLSSDKSDARELEESYVSIVIGAETPDGDTPSVGADRRTRSWGYFSCWENEVWHSDHVKVDIAVSRENFDRILAASRMGVLPTITVGFGSAQRYEKLEGPIRQEKTGGPYLWDNKTHPQIDLESCEFQFTRPTVETDAPTLDEGPGALLRGLGASFTVIWNVVAVLVTFAVFNATSTKFQVAAMSVLALIYLAIMAISREMPKLISTVELAQLSRYYRLRALLGVPTEEKETKYLERIQKVLAQRGANFWINLYGSAAIGLIVTYKLIMLMF